jgi:hypothetical protein
MLYYFVSLNWTLDQLQLVPLGGSTGPRRDQPGTPDFLFDIRDPNKVST